MKILLALESPRETVKGFKEKLLKGDEHAQDLKDVLQKLS